MVYLNESGRLYLNHDQLIDGLNDINHVYYHDNFIYLESIDYTIYSLRIDRIKREEMEELSKGIIIRVNDILFIVGYSI